MSRIELALVAATFALAFGCAASPPAVAHAPPRADAPDDFDEGVTVTPPIGEAHVVAPTVTTVPTVPTVTAEKPEPPPIVGNDPLVVQLLGGGGATLKKVLVTPETYRFQVLYSPVTEGVNGKSPALTTRGYRADEEYFFPASSMKVPISLALYERMALLRSSGKTAFSRDATLRIHPVTGNDDPWVTTVARETWRALIVSDNASANRLLAIVGHREAHETLWALGLASVRIHTGFAGGTAIDPAELSPRIEIGSADELAARKSDLVVPATDAKRLDVGEATMVNGRILQRPLSFADKNAIRLRDLQTTLVRIVRPDLLKAPVGKLATDDRDYMKQTLSTFPSESGLAGYDRNVVADYQLSPFLRGIERVRKRGHFTIYSKVGQAFGFLIANAYVVDKDTGKSFFLTAAIYANPGEVINDDVYAYDTISFPALADVGEVFCRHAFGS